MSADTLDQRSAAQLRRVHTLALRLDGDAQGEIRSCGACHFILVQRPGEAPCAATGVGRLTPENIDKSAEIRKGVVSENIEVARARYSQLVSCATKPRQHRRHDRIRVRDELRDVRLRYGQLIAARSACDDDIRIAQF